MVDVGVYFVPDVFISDARTRAISESLALKLVGGDLVFERFVFNLLLLSPFTEVFVVALHVFDVTGHERTLDCDLSRVLVFRLLLIMLNFSFQFSIL